MDFLRSHHDWTGFYLAGAGKNLRLGPFAGEPTEHTRIEFGTGVCGQAAKGEETIIVQDVSARTNYLSCSSRVRAEIVVPMIKDGRVAGVLDIDSHTLAPFGDGDKAFLEEVCLRLSGLF